MKASKPHANHDTKRSVKPTVTASGTRMSVKAASTKGSGLPKLKGKRARG